MDSRRRNPTVHATCLVIDGKGILIRGRAGAGKTSLALALIGAASRAGHHARLVADDRVYLEAVDGQLIGFVPPTIAGLVDRRGSGVYPIDHVARATIRLVVDIVEPQAPQRRGSARIDGVSLPRLDVARTPEPDAARVLQALETV